MIQRSPNFHLYSMYFAFHICIFMLWPPQFSFHALKSLKCFYSNNYGFKRTFPPPSNYNRPAILIQSEWAQMLSKSPSYLPTPPNFPVLGYFLPLLCGISYCNILCAFFFVLFFSPLRCFIQLLNLHMASSSDQLPELKQYFMTTTEKKSSL